MKCKSQYAKTEYTYYRYNISDVNLQFFSKILNNINTVSVGRGKNARHYCHLHCGFDIETYTTTSNNGYMYIWMFSIWDGVFNKITIHGRTWDDFVLLLSYFKDVLKLGNKKRLLVWVANLGYEWAFMRKHLIITDGFFKDERTPLKVTHDDCIDFQECLSISGGSLAYLSKTYTNTQKAVNDLDYTTPRNNRTVLTEQELTYCDNDVLILAEWSQYYFSEYILGGCGTKQQPLTIQSTIRKRMKDDAKQWHIQNGGNPRFVSKAIASCYPSEQTYHYLMKWCFRGGYTHGNIMHVGDKLTVTDNIASYDFTSSYPAVMEHNYFPSRLYRVNDVNTIKYYELIKQYCVIADITFYNVQHKTQHSIESKSKCIELENATIDNGRVFTADKMRVCITEVDFRNYDRFYSWDYMIINDCMIANRIRLPDYVLRNMEQDYTEKAIKKANNEPYSVQKALVNSYYGVMVTRLNELDWKLSYESESGLKSVKGRTYEDQIASSVLLPQWGIYITAWARFNILTMVKIVGNDCLYVDTDSIKIRHHYKYMWAVNQYNKRIEKQNIKMCEKRGLDINIYRDLGMLDCEVNKIFYLKYLGAKRYIYTYFNAKSKKLCDVQTIAGLPKTTLIERFKNNRSAMYDYFNNDMEVLQSGKLYSYYNDNEVSESVTDTQGHTVIMTELSNIGLAPCNFTMSLDKTWLEFFIAYQKKLKGREIR